VLARLFGGAGLVLGTGDADTTQPLNPTAIKAQGLRYVRVLSRWQLSEGQQRLDPDDLWVDQPEFYTINVANGQQLKLHPSRVVPFIGQKVPEGGFYSSASWFWGDPIMQSIGEAVKNADLAKRLCEPDRPRSRGRVQVQGSDEHVGTQEGEDRITRRVAWTSQAKSTTARCCSMPRTSGRRCRSPGRA
jgi:hypothetical protein